MDKFHNLISVSELQRLAGEPECCIIDCRFDLMAPDKGRADYAVGHIVGAHYAHLDDDLAAPVSPESGRHPLPDLERFQDCVETWGIRPTSQVVVYDYANGATAARLWWLLRWAGHDAVAVLNGGFAAWENANGVIVDALPANDRTSYSLSARQDMFLTTEAVLDRVTTGASFTLLDARDKRRFDGEIEPIDTVAGHVPGAVNLPFTTMVDAQGRWKDPDTLREIWGQAMENAPGGEMAAMCGSGVTACHLLVTAHLLGLAVPKLYVGSWSEWIRDPDRPVGDPD